MRARRDRASLAPTGSAPGGGGGACSSHSGRRRQTLSPSEDGFALGLPSAEATRPAHGQPACPMWAASPAASWLRGRSHPAARCRSRTAAMSGSKAAASSMLPGGSRSSAKASPRGVGVTGRAGMAKANNSSRSRQGCRPLPRRRSVAGAWTRSGMLSCSMAAASGRVSVSSSPSVRSRAARPCPATTAGAFGISRGGGVGMDGLCTVPAWARAMPAPAIASIP